MVTSENMSDGWSQLCPLCNYTCYVILDKPLPISGLVSPLYNEILEPDGLYRPPLMKLRVLSDITPQTACDRTFPVSGPHYGSSKFESCFRFVDPRLCMWYWAEPLSLEDLDCPTPSFNLNFSPPRHTLLAPVTFLSFSKCYFLLLPS